MIAKKALEAVDQAVCYELQNIVKNYSAVYASNHEAYAVLKEEYEEAAEELQNMQKALDNIWNMVKFNFVLDNDILECKKAAFNLALEAVQCAAVCERFEETIKREEKHEGLS